MKKTSTRVDAGFVGILASVLGTTVITLSAGYAQSITQRQLSTDTGARQTLSVHAIPTAHPASPSIQVPPTEGLVSTQQCPTCSCGDKASVVSITPDLVLETRKLARTETSAFVNFYAKNSAQLNSKISGATRVFTERGKLCFEFHASGAHKSSFSPLSRCVDLTANNPFLVSLDTTRPFADRRYLASVSADVLSEGVCDAYADDVFSQVELAAFARPSALPQTQFVAFAAGDKTWKKTLRTWLNWVCGMSDKPRKVSRGECFNEAMKAVHDQFPDVDISCLERKLCESLDESPSGAISYSCKQRNGKDFTIRCDFPHIGGDPGRHAPGSCDKPHMDCKGFGADGVWIEGTFEFDLNCKCWKWHPKQRSGRK